MCKIHYVLSIRTYLGNMPELVVCDPDVIKHILVKQFDKFVDRRVSIY